MLLRVVRSPRAFLWCLAAMLLLSTSAWAGHQVFNNRAVGGIAITVDGVLSMPAVEDRRILRDELAKSLRTVLAAESYHFSVRTAASTAPHPCRRRCSGIATGPARSSPWRPRSR